MKLLQAVCAIVLAGLASSSAQAHTVIDGVGGFQGGLLHPLLVPAHALALVALGLLTGNQSPRGRVTLVLAFVAGLAVSFALVSLAFSTANAELIVLAFAGVTGLLLASGRHPPFFVGVPVAAFAASAIVFDSVPAVPSVQDTVLSLGGTAIAATLIVAVTALLSAALPQRWRGISGKWYSDNS